MSEIKKLQLPYAQHVVGGAKLEDALDRVDKLPLPLGAAAALSELESDFVFFSPAMLYISGCFSDAIWIDLQKRMNARLELYHYKFNTQIFDGLLTRSGDRAWNYVLWAARKHQWQDIVGWVVSTVITDLDSKQALMFGEQDVVILDPLASDKKSLTVTRSTVSAFGLKYVKESYLLEEHPVRPYLKKFPPDPRVKEYVNILVDRKKNPLVNNEAGPGHNA